MREGFGEYVQGVKERAVRAWPALTLFALTIVLYGTFAFGTQEDKNPSTKKIYYEISEQYLQEFHVPHGYRVTTVHFFEKGVQLFLVREDAGEGASPPMYFMLTGKVPRTLYFRDAPK